MGINPGPKRTSILEDEVWRYYGDTVSVWGPKCGRCRDFVLCEHKPSQEAMSCWKVEVWARGAFMAQYPGIRDLDGIAEDLVREHNVVAKVSLRKIRVERTGLPLSGYPTSELDRLLVAYAQTCVERNALRRGLCALLGLDVALGKDIPVRRGCWLYDDILGPWVEWARPIC